MADDESKKEWTREMELETFRSDTPQLGDLVGRSKYDYPPEVFKSYTDTVGREVEAILKIAKNNTVEEIVKAKGLTKKAENIRKIYESIESPDDLAHVQKGIVAAYNFAGDIMELANELGGIWGAEYKRTARACYKSWVNLLDYIPEGAK